MVVWSPCSKFIAVEANQSIEVLDAATLNQLATFKYPLRFGLSSPRVSFSPDSRSLTLLHTNGELVTWDLQTGGRLTKIRGGFPSRESVQSSTRSKDGKMVVAAYKPEDCIEYKVYTFDLPSRTCLGPLIVSDGRLVTPIWTHDKYLRFATINRGSITIWEVEFTLKHPPTQVESFPIPDEVIGGDEFLFLPALYRLAFTLRDAIQVWDVKASKLLLKSERVSNSYPKYSFSSDGRFFAFAAATREIHVWKESPVGYVLHQQSPPILNDLGWLYLSPNGGSIVFPLDETINLWHARDQIPSSPSPPTEKRSQRDFILTFSLNQKSAAFAQDRGNVVTIIDLKSGNSRFTIDTGMQVKCLGVAGDTVIVADEERIVTWNMPGGDRAFNASINDSVGTVMLDCSPPSRYQAGRCYAHLSLSPDLSRIAVVGLPKGHFTKHERSDLGLEIHNVTTGTCLASTTPDSLSSPWFTRDGREVWVFERSKKEGWEIIKDSGSGTMELKPLEETSCPSGTLPWQSHQGYEVTDDGWVLSPTWKQLLWLPHHWRSDQDNRIWNGQFLGLPHRLSDVVILEFPEQPIDSAFLSLSQDGSTSYSSPTPVSSLS